MPTREQVKSGNRKNGAAKPPANGSAGPRFMRVSKGLGAVAIYRPGRAALLVTVALAALLAAGFGIGRATDPQPASSGPSSGTVRAARASGFEAGLRTGVARGRAERPAQAAVTPAKPAKPRAASKPAAPTAVSAAGALTAGAPYIVKVSHSGGRTQIVRHVQMSNGATYWICSDGNICTRPGG
jgi:hypothetical protein